MYFYYELRINIASEIIFTYWVDVFESPSDQNSPNCNKRMKEKSVKSLPQRQIMQMIFQEFFLFP